VVTPTPQPTLPPQQQYPHYPQGPTPSSAEVYVMLSLTTVTSDGQISNKGHLAWELDKLKEANADGFMVDVWWGITEVQPKVYNFGAYQELVQMAEERGLKVQLVTSFINVVATWVMIVSSPCLRLSQSRATSGSKTRRVPRLRNTSPSLLIMFLCMVAERLWICMLTGFRP
jgi:hypothetical protein